ncbi:hypothetical protein LX69_02284 [Breznakibacter xylanolyticus]|uniref:Uncharacterized protein n=1 Tax=Breznakibacter xylanolyticus TaxID=990 RepID=A0A2W7NNX9_9BACT|nr:hypothetical protein [Breznakibacter xylanolyticus]PZX14956.1 hypothetical protein LX69_02284 [Breznakibacter xylanolyticus]
MNKYLLALILASSTLFALAQYKSNTHTKRCNSSHCKITRVSIGKEKTMVEFNVKSPYINSDSTLIISLSDSLYIQDCATKRKYYLIKSNAATVYPNKYQLKEKESFNFSLEFKPIPQNCTLVNIIDNSELGGFNFYKVKIVNLNELNKTVTPNPSIFEFGL